LIKRSKQNKAKKLSKTIPSKEIGSERLSSQKSSFSPATALENSLDVSQDPLGNPKRKV
jgi:hypothetical protein